MDNQLLSQAIIWAAREHRNQTDKGGQPYVLHPLRVMMAVNTIEEKIVAVMHDLIEDTDVTYDQILENFGVEIADAVLSVSKTDSHETYQEFIQRAAQNPIGRMVKMADIRDNMNLDRPGSLEFLAGGIGKRYATALLYLQNYMGTITTHICDKCNESWITSHYCKK